jgi:aminoglycoside phosphotransferase (APT) family kinase protein
MDRPAITRLADWLRSQLQAKTLEILSTHPLKGGAIQENWLVEIKASSGNTSSLNSFVIRKDAPAAIASSHSRAHEFALLQLAYAGDVTVPMPIAFAHDSAILGSPFAVMAKADGIGFGPRIVKDQSLAANREQLGQRLGQELATIHALVPHAADHGFLGDKPTHPAADLVMRLRRSLDQMGALRPELEWGLRFAETNAPTPERITFCHHDFRTGNYMVDTAGLTAILDWEFAGWGDPMADIGWFTAQCWRFSRPDLEGGGVTSRAAFYAGYEAASGHRINHDAVLYWEIMAHLRWGVIALEQGYRHISGQQHALELALTGRMIAELEQAALLATAPQAWHNHG